MTDDCPKGRDCLYSAKLYELAEELLRLRAENEKLRAALKPFAELAEYYDVEPDAQPAWDRDFQPTVGELRSAAAALKETGDE